MPAAAKPEDELAEEAAVTETPAPEPVPEPVNPKDLPAGPQRPSIAVVVESPAAVVVVPLETPKRSQTPDELRVVDDDERYGRFPAALAKRDKKALAVEKHSKWVTWTIHTKKADGTGFLVRSSHEEQRLISCECAVCKTTITKGGWIF